MTHLASLGKTSASFVVLRNELLPPGKLMPALVTHFRLHLGLHEAIVHATLARSDLGAKVFAVVATSEEERTVQVVVLGLKDCGKVDVLIWRTKLVQVTKFKVYRRRSNGNPVH